MAFMVGSIISKLQLDKKSWDASIKSVKKGETALGGFAKRNSESFRKMGMAMTIAGGAITGAFGLMVKSAIKFNKEMANVSTLIPNQGKRVQELKKDVQDLSIQYGKSTDDIAGGLYQALAWRL